MTVSSSGGISADIANAWNTGVNDLTGAWNSLTGSSGNAAIDMTGSSGGASNFGVSGGGWGGSGSGASTGLFTSQTTPAPSGSGLLTQATNWLSNLFTTGANLTAPAAQATVQAGNVAGADLQALAQYATPSYYAGIVSAFQKAIQALASAADQVTMTLQDPSLDSASRQNLINWLGDFNVQTPAIVSAASDANNAISNVNSVGANIPQISVPTGLGIIPAVWVAAGAAAVAALALAVNALQTWTTYAQQKTAEAVQAVANSSMSPAAKTAALNVLQTQANTAQAASTSTLSNVSSILKWVAIGAAVYFGYKMLSDSGAISAARKHFKD